MADDKTRLIDLKGLKTYAEESAKQFAPQGEFTELKDEVSKLKLEGGEPNVIEHIYVNDEEVSPGEDKTINIQIPENVSDLKDSENYVTTENLPTELEDLNYVKEDALEGFFSEPDVATPEDITAMLLEVFAND